MSFNEDIYTDRRILRMEFDNAKFEKNIAKSTKSVADFKREMDFDGVSRGLSQFSEATEGIAGCLENLESYAERLATKFTGIGDVSEYVISRVRAGFDSAAKSAESFIKSISLDQISVGQTKYDALNKAVMTVTAAGKYTEEQAYQIFNRLMTYTDETSYSFTDMVGSISEFTASGQNLQLAEQVMEGIANATAKAGQGVAQASSAMSAFGKAIASGKMQLQQWNPLLQTSRIITEELQMEFVKAAVEIGTVVEKNGKYSVAPSYRSNAAKKVEQELSQLEAITNKTAKVQEKIKSLQDKKAEYDLSNVIDVKNLGPSLANDWLTTDVMMKALQRYYFEGIDDPEADWDSFAGQAAKAAQRAVSLADALTAMKEAVSSGWMKTYLLVWGELSESMATFTNIANRAIEMLEGFSEWRNNALEAWVTASGRKTFVEIILGDYGKDIADGVYGLMDMLEDAGNFIARGFSEFFKLFAPSYFRRHWEEDGFQEVFIGLSLQKFSLSIQNFFSKIRDFFNGEVLVNGETKSRLELFGEIVQGIAGILKTGYDIAAGFFSFIKNIAGQLGPSFDRILGFLGSLGLTIYNTSAQLSDSGVIAGFFSNLAESLTPVTSLINSVVDALFTFLEALFGIDNQNGTHGELFNKLGESIQFLAGVAGNVGGKVLSFLSKIVTAFKEFAQNGFSKDSFFALLSQIKDGIVGTFTSILDLIPDEIKAKIETTKEKIKNAVLSIFTEITKVFKGSSVKPMDKLIDIKSFQKIASAGLSDISSGNKASLEENNGSIFEAIGTWINSIVNKVKSFFENDPIGKIKNWLAIVGAKINDLRDFLETAIVNPVVQFIQSINWWLVGIGGFVVYITTKIISIMNNAIFIAKNISSTINNITTMLTKGVKVQPKVVQDKAGMFLKIAGAIALMVGSIIAISYVPWDQLKVGVEVVGGAMVALGLFIALLGSLFKKMDAKAVFSLFGIIAAIDILLIAMLPLAFINKDQMDQMGYGLMSLLGALAAFVIVMDFINYAFMGSSNGLKKDNLNGVLSIAGAIAIIVAALIPIAIIQAIDPNLLIGMGAALSAILFLLAAFSSAIGYLGGKGLNKENVNGVLYIAGAIAIIVAALIPLAIIQAIDPKLFISMGAGLLLILGMLFGFAVGINYLGGNALKKESVAGVVAIAGSIWLIVNALMPLASQKWDEGIAKMGAGLFAILLVLMTLLITLSTMEGGAESIEKAFMLVVISAAIGLMAKVFSEAVQNVRHIDWGTILAFSGGLAILLIAMARAIAILSKVDLISGIKGIVLMAAGFSAIIGVMTWLIPKLISATGTAIAEVGTKLEMFSEGIVGFVDNMEIVGGGRMDGVETSINKLKSIVLSVAGMHADVGSITDFGTCLFTISSGARRFYDNVSGIDVSGPDSALKLITELSENVGALEAVSKLDLSGMGGGLALFAAGMKKTAGIDMNEEDMPDVDAVVTMLGQLMTEINKNGGFSVPKDMPDATVMRDFGTSLAALALAMVEFQNASVGFDSGQTQAALGTLGFFRTLRGDITKQSIDWAGMVQSFYALDPEKELNEDAIKEANVSSLLQAFGNDIGSFGTALSDFSKALAYYDEESKTYKPISFQNGIDTLNSFVELKEKLPNIGGIGDFITGEKMTLTDLAAEIRDSGSALDRFTDSAVKAFGDDKAEARQSALNALGGFVKYMVDLNPSMVEIWTTGVLTNINTGIVESVISKTSGLMVTVSEDLVSFAENLGKINWTNEEGNQKQAIEMLGYFVTYLKDTLYKKFSDVKENGERLDAYWVETVAAKVQLVSGTMAAVGADLKSYGESLKEIDWTNDGPNQLAALSALGHFMTFLNTTMHNILAAAGTSSTDLSNYWVEEASEKVTGVAGTMKSVSESLVTFGKNLKEIDWEKEKPNQEAAIKALGDFADFLIEMQFKELPSVGGAVDAVRNFFVGHPLNITELADYMSQVGEGLGAFGTSIAGKFTEVKDVENVMVAIRGFTDVFASMATISTSLYGIVGLTPQDLLKNVVDFVDIMNGDLQSVNGKKSEEKISAVDKIINLMIGINSKIQKLGGVDGTAIQSFRDLAQALLHISLIDTRTNFIEVGDSIITGIAVGISSGESRLVKTMEAVMDAVVNAANARIQAHSPSKVFAEIGSYISAGLSIGITSGTENVVGSINAISDEAISEAGTLITKITEIMTQDIDTNPVITPVLDLENVRGGIDYMNRNLKNRSANVGLDVSIPTMYASQVRMAGGYANTADENQNGINLNGVYSRMESIETKLLDMNQSIRNMKMVLDTGIIAGAITDKIDSNLGRKSYYSGRRNL